MSSGEFALPLNVIGNQWSVILAIPGQLLYSYSSTPKAIFFFLFALYFAWSS